MRMVAVVRRTTLRPPPVTRRVRLLPVLAAAATLAPFRPAAALSVLAREEVVDLVRSLVRMRTSLAPTRGACRALVAP